MALTALLCASCSGGATAGTIDGPKAKLDRNTGSIWLPLDEFSASSDDYLVIDKANNLLIEDCVHDANPPMIPYTSKAGDGDNRIFGIWVKGFAERYGYDLVPGLEKIGYKGDASPTTEESIAAMNSCRSSLKSKLLPTYRIHDSGSTEPAAEGSLKSYNQLVESKEWKASWDSWKNCMKSRKINVTPDGNGAFDAVGYDSPNLESQVKIAVTEVECKDEINLTQRLADTMANYQNIFISENEAALIEQKKKLQAALETANKTIANHAVS